MGSLEWVKMRRAGAWGSGTTNNQVGVARINLQRHGHGGDVIVAFRTVRLLIPDPDGRGDG